MKLGVNYPEGPIEWGHRLGLRTVVVVLKNLSNTVKPEFANGHGMCQGGLISILANTAFAHAGNSWNTKALVERFSIDFIRPANVGERLTATAHEQSRGKLTGIYQVMVTNPKGKIVAIFNGTSFETGGAVLDD